MRRLLATMVLVLLAGCAGPGGAAGPTTTSTENGPNPFASAPPPSDVDVDTPELRALKAKANIAPCPRTRPTEPVEDGLPAITLPCLGGGRDVHLAGLSGPMVVNLWASWCAPCREELPVLQEYAEQAEGKVEVIGVDYLDTRPGAALELARQSGVTYPLLADVDAALEQPLRVGGMPWTVIVDAEGRVVRTLAGQIHSVEELDAAVEDAVGVSVGGGVSVDG